eukprot:6445773-Ditylum_brightwellii.AAC.1
MFHDKRMHAPSSQRVSPPTPCDEPSSDVRNDNYSIGRKNLRSFPNNPSHVTSNDNTNTNSIMEYGASSNCVDLGGR